MDDYGKLRSQYDKLKQAEEARISEPWKARAEKAEAELAVRSGAWCKQNRAEGRGGCGACAWCCKESRERAERAEARLSALESRLSIREGFLATYHSNFDNHAGPGMSWIVEPTLADAGGWIDTKGETIHRVTIVVRELVYSRDHE